ASPAPPVGLSAPPAPQAAPDVEVLPPPIAPASDPLFGMSRDFGTFLGGVPLMLAPTAAAPPTFGDRPVVVRRDPLGLSPGHAAQVRQPLIEPGPPRHEQANANANTNVELTDQTATRAMAPVSDAAAPPNSSPASAPARGQSPADEPPELFDATPEALDTLPDDSLEAISDVTQVLGEAPMAPAAHAPAPPPAPSRPAAMGTRPAPDARGGKTPARPPVRAVIPPPPAGAPVTRRPAPGARPGAGRAATAGAPPAGPFDGLVLPADVFSQMPVSGAVFGAPEVRARGGASSGAGAPGQRRLAVARPPTARQPGDAPPAAHTKTPAVRKPAEGPPAAPAKATASRKPAAPEKPVEQIQPARSIEPAADRLAPDSFDHASPPDAPEAHMGDVPSPEPRKKKKRKFPFLGLLLLLACAGGAAAGVWFLLAPTADVRAAIRFQGLDKYDPAKAADFARARADELRGTGATGNDVRTTAQKSYEAAFGAGGAGFLYGRTDADAAAFDSILHSAHVEGDRLILDDAKSHHAQRDARQFRALLKVFYALNASQGDAAAIQKAGLDRLQTAVAQAEQQIGELQQRSAERAKAQGEYAIAVQNVKDVTARAAKTQQVWSNAAGAARKLQADLDAIVSGAPAGQATSGDDDPQVSDLAQHLQELNGSLSAAWAAQGGDAAAAVSQALTPFQQDIDTYSAASAGGPAVADYLANARRGQRAMHQAIDDFGQQRRLNQQALEDLNRALAEPSPGILEANLLGQVLSAQTAKLKGDLGRLDEVLGAQLDLLGSAAPAPESLSSEGRQIVEQLSRRLLAVKAARQQVTGALASIGSGNAIASLENQLAQTRTALDARRRQLAAAPANGAVPGDAALAAASAKRTQIELTQTQRAKALADWEVAQRDATAAQEALDKLRPGQVDFSRDNSQLLALQLKRSGLASELDRQKANTILYPEDPDRDEAVHITRQTDVRGYVMAALGVLFAFLAGALIARRQHQSQPPFADHFSGLEHDESGAIHSRSGEPVGV
ncbi:MAG TPA: hypothetical protein VFC78_25030, partial [Tepidisphaeraceae bacterium]|nr:hypothetical protein [Tepidisphaeraceae bacterium]